MIEDFEPAIHQFFPVMIRPKNPDEVLLRSDKAPLTEPYFYMNIRSTLDAVCIERSKVDVWTITGQEYVDARLRFDVVLRKHLVSGHHVWRGQYQLPMNRFFSDALGNEIIARKWKGITLTPVEEV